jgi:flagellar hook-basal body complex protein FliE
MNIYIGDPTAGFPVANFTKGIEGVEKARNGFGAEAVKPADGMSFGDLLARSLESVSDSQNEAAAIGIKAVTNPDDVSVHEVSVAMAKANMSLSLAKAVIDRSVTGFKEILNQR